MPITLPKQPDEEIMKLLIKAKHFLEHAKQHIALDNDFDIMIAIHSLDNSIEYILRILIRHLEIEEITGTTINSCELAQLIGTIQKFLRDNTDKSLSLVPEMKMIRELRNLVQHGMILPTHEVEAYFSYGEKFFLRTLEKFFGITIDKINYSTIIKSDFIRDLICQAENKIAAGVYLEAIVAVRDAFDYAGFIYNRTGRTRIYRAPVLAELKETSENLFYYLKEIDKKINLNVSNIDAQKYKQYAEYIDCIPREYRAERHGNTVLNRPWNKHDAEFCYSFVANAILQWELSEYQPIQEHSTDFLGKPIKFVETIGGVEIGTVFSGFGCLYAYETWLAHLFYCDNSTVEKIRECLQNKVVEKNTKRYHGDIKDIHKTSICLVKNYNIDFLMNQPPTWEVIVIYNEIPFTGMDMLHASSINIDDANRESLLANALEEKLVDILLDFHENNGPLDSIAKAFDLEMQLKEVDSDNQLWNFVSPNLIKRLKESTI